MDFLHFKNVLMPTKSHLANLLLKRDFTSKPDNKFYR